MRFIWAVVIAVLGTVGKKTTKKLPPLSNFPLICTALGCQGHQVTQRDNLRGGSGVICTVCGEERSTVNRSMTIALRQLGNLIPLAVSEIDTEDLVSQEYLSKVYPHNTFIGNIMFPLKPWRSEGWAFSSIFEGKKPGNDDMVDNMPAASLAECAPMRGPVMQGDYVSVTMIGVLRYRPMKRETRLRNVFKLVHKLGRTRQNRIIVTLSREDDNPVFDFYQSIPWPHPSRHQTVFMATTRNMPVSTALDPTSLTLAIGCADFDGDSCLTRTFTGWMGFFCNRLQPSDIQRIENRINILKSRHERAREWLDTASAKVYRNKILPSMHPSYPHGFPPAHFNPPAYGPSPRLQSTPHQYVPHHHDEPWFPVKPYASPLHVHS